MLQEFGVGVFRVLSGWSSLMGMNVLSLPRRTLQCSGALVDFTIYGCRPEAHKVARTKPIYNRYLIP